MKIPAVALHFGLGATISISIAFALSSYYEVPEEERIKSLIASNPKLNTNSAHRKEYEDKMQTFFRNMKNNDKDQTKTFDDILKKGVKKEEKNL